MGNTSSAAPPPPDPYLSPHKPYSQRKLEYCYKLNGTNSKLLTKVKPSPYKCPAGWIQNNYIIERGWNYSSDQLSGFCTNPYLDPFSANSETAGVPFDDSGWCRFGETKTIARFSYGPKKDGSPSYFQKLENTDELLPLGEKGCIAIAPVFPFKVLGKNVTSATQIRDMYKHVQDPERKQIIIDLYGKFDQGIYNLFNKKLK